MAAIEDLVDFIWNFGAPVSCDRCSCCTNEDRAWLEVDVEQAIKKFGYSRRAPVLGLVTRASRAGLLADIGTEDRQGRTYLWARREALAQWRGDEEDRMAVFLVGDDHHVELAEQPTAPLVQGGAMQGTRGLAAESLVTAHFWQRAQRDAGIKDRSVGAPMTKTPAERPILYGGRNAGFDVLYKKYKVDAKALTPMTLHTQHQAARDHGITARWMFMHQGRGLFTSCSHVGFVWNLGEMQLRVREGEVQIAVDWSSAGVSIVPAMAVNRQIQGQLGGRVIYVPDSLVAAPYQVRHFGEWHADIPAVGAE